MSEVEYFTEYNILGKLYLKRFFYIYFTTY